VVCEGGSGLQHRSDLALRRAQHLRAEGRRLTYDPRRLQGVQVFREVQREFAVGEKIQMTASNKGLGLANRDLGTITAMQNGQIAIRMDGKGERSVTFDPREFRQFDHGYAVTSHSSQGLTSKRVLVNMDTEVHPELINGRFAYVSVSRASQDVHIFTNDATTLAESLSRDASKTSAVALNETQIAARGLATEPSQLAKKETEFSLGLSL